MTEIQSEIDAEEGARSQRIRIVCSFFSALHSRPVASPLLLRKVLFVLTFSIMADPSGSSDFDRSSVTASTPVIVAVVEGKGACRRVIGMASMDTMSGEIEMRQFTDTPEYTVLGQRLQLLQVLNSTTEVLIPNSMHEDNSQYIIRSSFGTQTNPIDRANFSDVNGLQCIEKLAQNPQNLLNQVSGKTLSLAALSALIAYTENNIQSNFSLGALKITFKTSESLVAIDPDTVFSLELLVANKGDSKYSLFGFLNHCLTRGGCKLLRSLILEPPTQLETIGKRQDAVAELKLKEDVFEKLRNFLQILQIDIESVISKTVQIPRGNIDSSSRLERDIDLLVYLKHVLELMETLIENLNRLESEKFRELASKLENSGHLTILEMIKKVISDECIMTKGCVNYKTTKAFAVRKELSQYLEIERDAYSEIMTEISEQADEIKNRHGFDDKCFKMIYSVKRGFHLLINSKVLTEKGSPLILPTEFIRVEEKQDSVCCTTEALVIMCSRLQFKHQEINRVSHV